MPCLSCVFFAFNLLLLCCGAAIGGVGIWTVTDPTFLQKYVNLPVDQLLVVSYVAMVVGGMLILIGLVGCCGAIMSNPCILCLFSIVLGILVTAGIVAGIVGYVAATNESFGRKIKDALFRELKKFDAFGNMQKDLKCCGVKGPGDYNSTDVPSSCRSATGELYKEGCWQKIKEILMKKIHVLGGMTGTLAVIGIITLILSMAMLCSKKSATFV